MTKSAKLVVTVVVIAAAAAVGYWLYKRHQVQVASKGKGDLTLGDALKGLLSHAAVKGDGWSVNFGLG